MAINKITFKEDILDFVEMLQLFECGKMYVAFGSFDKTELEEAFAGTTEIKQTLDTYFEEISDLAEKPGKLESKTEKYKTLNYSFELSRKNTISLNLVGVSQARKKWLEEDLNKQNVTFCLENTAKDAVMLFNGLRWVSDWNYEIGDLFNFTVNTEFPGKTDDKIVFIKDINQTVLLNGNFSNGADNWAGDTDIISLTEKALMIDGTQNKKLFQIFENPIPRGTEIKLSYSIKQLTANPDSWGEISLMAFDTTQNFAESNDNFSVKFHTEDEIIEEYYIAPCDMLAVGFNFGGNSHYTVDNIVFALIENTGVNLLKNSGFTSRDNWHATSSYSASTLDVIYDNCLNMDSNNVLVYQHLVNPIVSGEKFRIVFDIVGWSGESENIKVSFCKSRNSTVSFYSIELEKKGFKEIRTVASHYMTKSDTIGTIMIYIPQVSNTEFKITNVKLEKYKGE